MKKILLIEDDFNTRELFAEILKDAGYDVVAVENGEKGIIEAVNGGFDLILLDIMMPKMDGMAFIKQYKEFEKQLPNGPFVMLSVLKEEQIIQGCLALGAAGYLIKSELTPDELLKEVVYFLSLPPKILTK